MAIGKIRNLGGGNATKEKYLYKEGTQFVAWDNSGYRRTQYYSYAGIQILANSFKLTTPSGAEDGRVIITDSSIDLSKYSILNAIVNGIHQTLSIANINSGYIYFEASHGTGSYYGQMGVTTSKSNYADNRRKYNEYLTSGGTFSYTVTKIWLS